MNEITVNGEVYVKKAIPSKILMVRSYAAGVFYGEIVSQRVEAGVMIVEMVNARRVWYWEGASSLSQLAEEGTKKPDKCKFPCKVPNVLLVNVVEVLGISEQALRSLEGVPVWEQK